MERNRASSPQDNISDGSKTSGQLLSQSKSSSTKIYREGSVLTSPQQGVNALTRHPNFSESQSTASAQPSAPKRSRFAPQLIETARRSRKSGDTVPALLPTDKTDLSPGDKLHLPRHLRLTRPSLLPSAPVNTPVTSSEGVPRASESRFSSTTLSRKAPRRRSFQVPDLAPIQSQPDSEESNDSNCPSLSTSPSATSDHTELYKHASRLRESCDDRFSGYLLALAARAAEKQLKEQAMAAYPNENAHEPVDHFAIDRDSDASDEEEGIGLLPPDSDGEGGAARQDSAVGWDMSEMRRQQGKLEEQQRQYKVTEQMGQRQSKSPPQDAAMVPEGHPQTSDIGGTPRHHDGRPKALELQQMRSAASPPMLGQDLRFPKFQSPQQTRFEADQYPSSHKSSVCETNHDHNGLWTPTDSQSRRGSAGGLWHGFCAAPGSGSSHVSKLLQTGLMTPQVERDDPFAKLSLEEKDRSSLPAGILSQSGLDRVFSLERTIEAEFHDGFVTQIYNYLSLGYPSLARKFDDELSKISKVPLDDLRRDDERKNTKGYVGAPEGSGSNVADVQNGQCGRWKALRLYIHEWAKQQPSMVERDAGANNDWGVRARRGSWAI